MIRKLTTQDQELLKAWASCFSPEPIFNWTPQDLVGCLGSCEIWGYLKDHKLVSAIALQKSVDSTEILWLATLPQVQKQGCMRELLTQILDNASGQSQSVQLEVHEKNQKALQLYTRFGFKHVGTRKNYYRDGGSALLLTYSGPAKSS